MHLSKTDRNAILWALNALGEMEIENESKAIGGGYPDEFEWLWKSYPERSGGKGDKRKAFQNCQARIKEGEDWKTLARFMKAYEEHCKKEGKIGTGYVLQFTTFFGPGERYKDDYSDKAPQDADKPAKKTGQQSLIDRANSGELYEDHVGGYLAPNGHTYACAIDYYAGKEPIS